MNVKLLPLLSSMLTGLVLAACSGSAQASTPEESRRGGFWVFILFLALAAFFWWWLRQSDGQAAAPSVLDKKPIRTGDSSKPVTPAPTATNASAGNIVKPMAETKSESVPSISMEASANSAEAPKIEAAETTPVSAKVAESTPVTVAARTEEIGIEDPVRTKRMADRQKKAQKKGPGGEDDFTIVEGIGPKINGVLHDAGLKTYNELASTAVEVLREILAKNNLQYHDPGTWPEQSALAAADKWDDLESLQGTLSGGKRK